MIAGRRIRKYGCGAWYNRPGYGGRNPAHPIDYIREEKVIALVDDFLKGLTLEKIQARLAEQARPTPDAGRMRWLTEQWQAVAEQAREIETELESIRTPAGRSALGAELKRLNDQAEELNGQIQSVGAVSEMLPDDYARTLMAFVGSGGWKSKTPAEIRTALCYLKFYIREGKLVGGPVGVD